MAWCPPRRLRKAIQSRFAQLTQAFGISSETMSGVRPRNTTPIEIPQATTSPAGASHDVGGTVRPCGVGLVVDTPNITRGLSPDKPNWRRLWGMAAKCGGVVRGVAVVNAGCPGEVCDMLKAARFEVERSHGKDLDDDCLRVLAQVAADDRIGTVVLGAGDFVYGPALKLARAAGKKIIVMGTPASISRVLTRLADEVWTAPSALI